ncbi:MAG TPA: LLM class flavin-dependent oxidoreductase, partial [Actinomycetota bacterium]|nr:LLM class flavin-dependent oxidoreductase [Actinomycetota bacterium]
MGFSIDAVLPPGIDAAADAAPHMEAMGYAGLYTTETQSDPFLDLAPVARTTSRAMLGTNLAIAFARSPFVTATAAWQLQRASKGRFVLGLGTQVKGHIERRFGMTWEAPGPKMREYVQALRAIWAAFQGTQPLSFEGRFYT